MDARLRSKVRRRARFRCEYCHFPERLAELRFQIDHIVAKQHSGSSTSGNLALACFRCNSRKGPNLSGIDPKSLRIVQLFNPRKDHWEEHFYWKGPQLLGLTPTARATIVVLGINRADVLILRTALLDEGYVFD